MDVASIVYSLTIGIVSFISEHDDHKSLTKDINKSVLLVQKNIKPLFAHPKSLEENESLNESLHALQDVLLNIYYHLRLWKESKSHRALAHLYPWKPTQQLQDDRQMLVEKYLLLMGATQFVDRLQGFHVISRAPTMDSIVIPPPSLPQSVPFKIEPKDDPENLEVTKFWYHCVGDKTTLAESETFCVDISAYLALDLSPVACKRLLLRLDERGSGNISFSALQELVNQGPFADVIKTYTQDPALPLLIWIDDDVVGNQPKVLEASKSGVTVIQLASTAAAKSWITINEDFIKAHDNPAEIRFISDQVRFDTDSSGTLFENHEAGTQIYHFIRGHGIKAPFLVYTDPKSILVTHYIDHDDMAGSLNSHYKVYKEYVNALGAGRKDDRGWAKFNA
ncbi:hypothetical protein JR316_0007468 [Psilocybe cubensis]|uniref:Uncharacterized protein n=2 Tax=Psilocybe cubensis TaxID=181762 RepID=A0ACB8H058_PSICU|nr:hypothetical protein JR316_0007468 [Psilocybe cubensis]KAH9480866.1 hypothetical protein JR316_0007468 [Psilocybe cubensis]